MQTCPHAIYFNVTWICCVRGQSQASSPNLKHIDLDKDQVAPCCFHPELETGDVQPPRGSIAGALRVGPDPTNCVHCTMCMHACTVVLMEYCRHDHACSCYMSRYTCARDAHGLTLEVLASTACKNVIQNQRFLHANAKICQHARRVTSPMQQLQFDHLLKQRAQVKH